MGAVALVHLLLVLHFSPPAVIFGEEPLFNIDFPLHYYQTDRAMKAYAGWGKLWGYDPGVLAGYPTGTLEDVSSKTVELFVIALSGLGVRPTVAFNLYALLIHLLLPLVGFLCARLFRLTPPQSVGVGALWVLLWFFDSFFHWMWFCGMISWSAAGYLIVLLVGLLYRAMEEQRVLVWWVPVGLLASFMAVLHPFAAVTLAVPCLGLYLRDLRRLTARSHAMILGSLAAVIACAMIWLGPALEFRHFVLTEETFLRPTLGYLISDYLDILWNSLQTGPSAHTLFRVLCLVCAAIYLVRWRRQGDRRFLPLALLIGMGLLLAYGGGHTYWTKVTQPYRHIVPAALAAAIPAAVLLSELLDAASIRQASRSIKVLLALLLVLLLPRLAGNLIYYFPELLSTRDTRLPRAAQIRPTLGGVDPMINAMRYEGPPAEAKELRAWLEQNLQGRGRVLVENYMLGEYLRGTSDLPILGGLLQRSFPHGDAHLFRLNADGDLPGEKLRAYLERYNVRYVVMSELKRKLEWRKELLTFRRFFKHLRLYETTIQPSYFLKGQGKIAHQGFNSIKVKEAAGEELVLRFHYMRTLRCRPDCKVERHEVPGDRVGFIRVRRPPGSFEIYNSYQFY